MTTIQSLDELAQKRIQECAPKAVGEFKSSVRPVYGLEDKRLTHVGTCLLLNVDGHQVVSTAAHVADNLAHSPLFVGGPVGTHPVQLQARFRSTTPPGGKRAEDHFDSAYCALAADDVAALGAIEFLNADRISPNRASSREGRAYTAFGYAVSRNKDSIDHNAGSIANRLSMYTGHVVDVPALNAKLPLGGGSHLTLNFEKRAFTADGQRVDAFRPTGLSGGALLDLGDFTSPAMYAPGSEHQATLAGMLIEHRREHRVMLAVKIGSIVDGIMRDLAR